MNRILGLGHAGQKQNLLLDIRGFGQRNGEVRDQTELVWLREARSLGLKGLNRFCQTLENWLKLIANYYDSAKSGVLGCILYQLDRMNHNILCLLDDLALSYYFVERSSNGSTEGFNNGLRSILRRAFGMQNFQNFRARVLHLLGKPKTQESP